MEISTRISPSFWPARSRRDLADLASYFDKNLGENLGEILIQIFLGEFLAAEILRSRRDPAENLGEISWRSRRESRRVFGRRDSRQDLGQNFAGDVMGKSWKVMKFGDLKQVRTLYAVIQCLLH